MVIMRISEVGITLLLFSEKGGSVVPRNVGILPHHYTVLTVQKVAALDFAV
jgi:hypothetical protein